MALEQKIRRQRNQVEQQNRQLTASLQHHLWGHIAISFASGWLLQRCYRRFPGGAKSAIKSGAFKLALPSSPVTNSE